MTTAQRLPVFVVTFAAAYAILYFLAVDWNWALFTYHPALGTFGVLTTAAKAGPTMYWYGWMLTAALGAAVIAALAAFLPQGIARRIPSCLAWAIPVCILVAFAFLLRGFFMR